MTKIRYSINKWANRLYKTSLLMLTCKIIKKLKIPNGLFYKWLRFYGKFSVEIDPKRKFDFINYGGSIENETFWKGLFATWENHSGWIWMQLCEFSEVIFDIGANKGVYSLVAKAINPDAKIYAFEPSESTYCQLKENIEINHFDIIAEKIALSNSDSTQVFYDVPYYNQTSASLSSKQLKYNDSYSGEIIEYEVRASKLSSYIKEKCIDKIDLIKLDVELHEVEVIEGLECFLEEFKPIVIIEILSDEIADKLNETINIKEYRIFHLRDNGIAERCDTFRSTLTGEEWNYLFFHQDKEEMVKRQTTLYSCSAG